MTEKATPRPIRDDDWFIEEQGEFTSIGAEVLIYGKDGDVVVGVCGSMGLGIEAIDRARHIVKCVNCHDELLAALERAKECIKIWHGDIAWEVYDKHAPEMKLINAAIAKARKEG